MRTRALGWGFGLLVLTAGVGRADESEGGPAGAAGWPEVAAEVLAGHGPIALHVLVTADSKVAVRGGATTSPRNWREAGSADWGEGSRGQDQGGVPETLDALRSLVAPDPATGILPRDPQGWTRGLLIADLAPWISWGWAQRILGLARAAGVRVRHVLLRADGRTALVDLAESDVPEVKEWRPLPPAPPVPAMAATVPSITVKVIRTNLDRPRDEHLTKVLVGSSFARALPPGPMPGEPSARAQFVAHGDRAIAEVVAELKAARARSGPGPVRGRFEVPFPAGLAVPVFDALRVLGAIRAAGLEPIHVDWTPAPRPEPAPWAEEDLRTLAREDPFYVQVHIGTDGRVTVRSTGGTGSWIEHDGGALSVDDPEGSMRAIQDLHTLFGSLLRDKEREPALWAEDGRSRARLLIDAEDAAPWRYAQWVIATAESPQTRIFKRSLRSPEPSGWIDLDDRKHGSRSTPGVPETVLAVDVKLFRHNLERPEREQYTSVRIGRREVAAREIDGKLRIDVEERDEGLPASEPDPKDTIDLPRADEPAELHDARWRAVEERLRVTPRASLPRLGEVQTPFPKGLAVPYADVVRVIGMLQRVGYQAISVERAPYPKITKEGGGWDFPGK